ncbi:hypothetical protein GCM10020219_038420 [Nonomuraea dietziae]
MVGPGLGTDDWAHELVARVLATDVPVLVDADALTIVAREKGLLRRTAPVLITPHAGELSRAARGARRQGGGGAARARPQGRGELGVTVLAQGVDDGVLAEQDRPVRVNPTGTRGWHGSARATCCRAWEDAAGGRARRL